MAMLYWFIGISGGLGLLYFLVKIGALECIGLVFEVIADCLGD